MFSVMFICLSVHRHWSHHTWSQSPSVQDPSLSRGSSLTPSSPDMFKLVQFRPHCTGIPPSPQDIFKLSIMKKSGRLVSYWSFLKRLRLYWKNLFFYLFELFSNTRGISIVRLRFLCLISLNVLLFPNLTENNFLCWFTFSKTHCFFLTIICA